MNATLTKQNSEENAASSPFQGTRELYEATRPFACESRVRSWFHISSTFILLGGILFVAGVSTEWPLRTVFSIIGALLLVRAFILYHDFQHGAILRKSWLATGIFSLFGLIFLTPPRYWKQSHNTHHANVGKPLQAKGTEFTLMTSGVGAFELMSTDVWQRATWRQRLRYRITRHVLTLIFAYVTVFTFSICLEPLMRNPRRYWDCALSILVHGSLIAILWLLGGIELAFFSWLLPFTVASALGAYLFFAQHNFPGMLILSPDEWTPFRGAMESSSYMKLGPLMHWFTGNIGYHHIHHMNSLIPFYRLPETMAKIPAFQHPHVTTLHPRDILACLRLNLWDRKAKCLVPYPRNTPPIHTD